MWTRACCILAAVSALLLGGSPALSAGGAADGRVCVLPSPTQAFGFSSYSGLWTATNLDSAPLVSSVGGYLGYVRTAAKIFAFNSVNDHWYSAYLADPPSSADGEEAEGATIVHWGSTQAWGIATPWAVWRSTTYLPGEQCRGGGSGGNFGLVWTTQRALAYSATNGQWHPEPLDDPALGGIADGGMGLVWTMHQAIAFDPVSSTWYDLDLGVPDGVAAAGSGSCGVVWTSAAAEAYSGTLNQWYPLQGVTTLRGAQAGGEVALVWGDDWAYAFSAASGLWSTIHTPGTAGAPPDAGDLGGFFTASPNPSAGGVEFRLPDSDDWSIVIVDATGARVAALEGRDLLEWDARGVPAGVYWASARSGGKRAARRIVLL